MEKILKVLFRCDGDSNIGLGHITRCLALSDELRDVHNCQSTFAIRKGTIGTRMVEDNHYPVIISRENGQKFDYESWLNECIDKVHAEAVVFDVRDGLSKEAVKKIKDKRVKIITIDDPEDKRLEANLAFYPSVPQIEKVDWTGFTGELFTGWEWLVLRKEFSNPNPRPLNKKPVILVTMGGSDPAHLTLKAIESLESVNEEFKVIVILGRGFQPEERLDSLLSQSKHHFEVLCNVKNMAEIMSQSDLAIASFGVTAYELTAMGVPTIYLCLTSDHAESASVFEDSGIGINLGLYDDVEKKVLAQAISSLLMNSCLRESMSNKACNLIDCKGAQRIAKLIFERVYYLA
jgi:UDP-2,4-diacetamido-2,4,6-trideoxy-beta-L-altropyranose hydrolase